MPKPTIFLDFIAMRNKSVLGYDYEFAILSSDPSGLNEVSLLPGKVVFSDFGQHDLFTACVPFGIPERLAAMALAVVVSEVREADFTSVTITNATNSTLSVEKSPCDVNSVIVSVPGSRASYTRAAMLMKLKQCVLDYLHRPAGYDDVILRIGRDKTPEVRNAAPPKPKAPEVSQEKKILESVLDILADTSWQHQGNSVAESERCEKGRLRQLTAALELSLPILIKNALEGTSYYG